MPITKAGFSGRSEERAMPLVDVDEDGVRARPGKTVTIKGGKKGQSPIKFKAGGLHESVGVPEGEPIPADKLAAAKAGKYGPKAEKQANFAGALVKMRPSARGTLPSTPEAGERVLGAGVPVIPTAVLAGNKRRPQGGK